MNIETRRPLTKAEIHDKVVSIITDALGFSPNEISDEDTFETLDAESIDWYDVKFRLQKKFCFELEGIKFLEGSITEISDAVAEEIQKNSSAFCLAEEGAD